MRFDIRRLILFHGIRARKQASVRAKPLIRHGKQIKRTPFAETSDGEMKCWLTIQHKET